MNRGSFLTALFLVALTVRVAFVLTREEALYFPDSKTYDAIAQNFRAGKGLILDENWKVTRPPLYPVFLAGCTEVFGHRIGAVRVVQAVLGAFVCVLVVLLGEETLDEVSGRVGGGIAAFYPFFIFFCGLLLTETLFVLLFVLAMWLLAKAEKGRLWWAVGAGVVIGAGILLRSSLLLFWIFLAPFWVLWFGGGAGRALRSLAVGIAATTVVCTPWVARNYVVTGGRFVPTTLQVGRSLYEANNPEATGGPGMHVVAEEAARRDAERAGKGLPPLTEYEDNAYFRRKALTYMRQHVGRTLRLAGVKCVRFWNGIPNYSGYRGWFYIAVSLLAYVPVMGLAAVGLAAVRHRLSRCGLLLVPVLYFGLLHMVFVGSIRYRMPVMPFVILLAGAGVRSMFWTSDEDGREEDKATEEEET
ncbi:MAG: glycosyltransferase family 39 protein [Planctomycetes bacterium]|nr:glycosyltransferase family 39 protein [Planctomycetota bacterium]